MDNDPELLTIGELARRTGLPVRTLRFWSDEGAVPPAGRSASGYRLYDAAGAARAGLVRTLRELGLGLADVRRVLDGRTTVAEVADAHIAALDAHIRSLKVSRAVWSAVAREGTGAEGAAVMNRLARLSVAESRQIIDDFKEDVFGPLDLGPRQRDRLRDLRVELPDDPTADQVDAWIELAGLVQDPGFRARMRAFLELTTAPPDQPPPPGACVWWARQVVEEVAKARRDGVAPADPAAARLVGDMFGDADRGVVLASLEAGLEAGAERYRRLVARVRGGRAAPDATADLRWLAAALRVSRRG